jgi:hypothetical protein
MQETEIKRIMVPGQPRQMKLQRFHLNDKKLGMVMRGCHASDGKKLKKEDQGSGQPGQKVRYYLKSNESKKKKTRGGGRSSGRMSP